MSNDAEYLEALRSLAVPLGRTLGFQRLIDHVKGKQVVFLGESTHGSEEFYFWRKLVTLELLHNHGFKFVAVEADWPDAARFDDYIRLGRGGAAATVAASLSRWPTWMWANLEVADLVESMRTTRAGFYGLDVYSLFTSIAAVSDYVRRQAPRIALDVLRRYACFEPFGEDEIAYARSLLANPAGCEEEVMENLVELLGERLTVDGGIGRERALFSAQQNARIVRNAERYYRAMLGGDAGSWNIRDRHMQETLDQLVEFHGGKGIVWAHNTHIGDYHATSMLEAGYVNLGGLARAAYGPDAVALVGFDTYRGEVTASHAWDGPTQLLPLPPANPGSLAAYLHQLIEGVREPGLVLTWARGSAPSALARAVPQRAIGVVYDPDHEQRSNYVPTELTRRYDALVFVDRTSGLREIPASFRHEKIPETWPTGA